MLLAEPPCRFGKLTVDATENGHRSNLPKPQLLYLATIPNRAATDEHATGSHLRPSAKAELLSAAAAHDVGHPLATISEPKGLSMERPQKDNEKAT